jgi:hypothetical protein
MAARGQQRRELLHQFLVQVVRDRVGARGVGLHATFDGLRACGRRARRTRGATARTRPPHDLRVVQLRQHAGLHQPDVDVVVQRVESLQHVALEHLQDDQAHADVDVGEFAQRFAERFGQRVRGQRVRRIGGGAAATQHRQPLVQRHQCGRQAPVGLGDHAGNRQRFLELAIVDQAQFAAGRECALRFVGARRPAGREIGEAARDAFAEHALDARALLAGLAHAVEVFGLAGVAFGLFGKVEQGVVDVVEQFGNQVAGLLQRHFAHGHQQAADVLLAGLGCARTDAHHLVARVGVGVGGIGYH